MLGLGASLSCQNRLSDGAAAIDDYMWDLITTGELAPLATGTVSDFHDTWDLDGTDYTLAEAASISDEGYWDLDGNSDAQPLDL